MANTGECDVYQYWNTNTTSCQPCGSDQEIRGNVSWAVFAFNAIALCCVGNQATCPALVSFIIAMNYTYCNTQWSPGITNTLLFMQFLLVLLTTLMIVAECQTCNRLHSISPNRPKTDTTKQNLSSKKNTISMV